MSHLARRHSRGSVFLRLLLPMLAGFALGACGSGGDGGTAPIVQPVPPTVTSVDVTGAAGSLLPQQTVQLSAVARLSNGTSNSTPAVSWSTSAASVATVSASGLVTAVAAGTATITATVGAVSGTLTITVTPPATSALASVVATLADATLLLAQTTQATVVGRDGAGAPLALGARVVTWSTSNTAIATVSRTGLVSAVGIGTVNVLVSVADGAVTRSASAPLTITPIPGAPLAADVSMPGLTFSPFETLLKQGGTVRFIFPTLPHNVIWDARLAGQAAAPTDINTTNNVVITRTFPNAGVFLYKCTLHPGMDGTIIVTP